MGLELFLRPGGRASLYLTFPSPAARDAAVRQLAAQPALRLAARCYSLFTDVLPVLLAH